MSASIEETLATLQSSVNLLAGIVARQAQQLRTIEWRLEWEVEAWRKSAIAQGNPQPETEPEARTISEEVARE